MEHAQRIEHEIPAKRHTLRIIGCVKAPKSHKTFMLERPSNGKGGVVSIMMTFITGRAQRKARRSASFRLAIAVLSLAVWTAGAMHAQITSNPIPAPVVKRGLAVQVKDLVRLPDTRGIRAADQDVAPAGWARVSYVRDLPDGRRFANDSRGFI